MIGIDEERKSSKYMLSVWFHDGHIYIYIYTSVAERTSHFCLARNLIRPLGSTQNSPNQDDLSYSSWTIFPESTTWGNLPNTFFSQNSFVQYKCLTVSSSIAAAAASNKHEGSRLIYGPLASILLDQGFPVEYELDEFNTPHAGTTLHHPQNWLCWLWCKIPLRHLATSSLGNIF